MKKLKYLIICFALSLLFSGNVFACEDATAASLGPSDDSYFDGDIIGYSSAFGASAPTQFVPDPCAVTNIVAYFLDPSIADQIEDKSNPCASKELGTIVYEGGSGVVLQPGESIFIDKDTTPESAVMEYTVKRADAQIIEDDLSLFAAICYDYDRINDEGDPVEGSGNQRTSDNSLSDPDFSVTKECTADGDLIGGVQKAPFDVIINNTGNVDMDFLVADEQDPSIDGTYTIAAGESLTLKPSLETVCPSSSVENSVTVTALIDGELAELIDKEPNTNPATKSDTCDVICPDCRVVKSCDKPAPGGTVEGELAPFTVTVYNDGDIPLNIDWVDTPANKSGTINALAAGASQDILIDIPTAGECDEGKDKKVENDVSITCYVDGIVEPVDSDESDAVCPVLCKGCSVEKKCALEEGELIYDNELDMAPFEVIISNTGEVPIIAKLTDPEYPDINMDYEIAPMSKKVIDTVELPTNGECDDDAKVFNSVAVECFVVGDEIAFDTDKDEATCPVECVPNFTVEKDCLTIEGEIPEALEIGEDAPFKITLKNTGDVDLTLKVDDLDAEPQIIGKEYPIAAGESEIIDIIVPVEECPAEQTVGNSVTAMAYVDGQPVLEARGDDAVCKCEEPQMCWLTAGGVKFENIVRERMATVSATGTKKGGPKDSVGGVAYPGCSPEASNGGQWNHVAHNLGMHLIGKDIQVTRCGNVPGIDPGSESPVCSVNFIQFQGQGVVKGIHGNKMDVTPVTFYVRAEDRNEPGNEHASDGEDIDRYFLKVVDDISGDVLILVDEDGDPGTVDPLTITGGNFQIHCTSCDE